MKHLCIKENVSLIKCDEFVEVMEGDPKTKIWQRDVGTIKLTLKGFAGKMKMGKGKFMSFILRILFGCEQQKLLFLFV